MAHAWGVNILIVRQYKCILRGILMTPKMPIVTHAKNSYLNCLVLKTLHRVLIFNMLNLII